MLTRHLTVAILPLWIGVGSVAASHRAAAQAPPTLCAEGERVVFAAALTRSTKVVSLCASPGAGDEPGAYVQYRFGRPGSIELQFPEERAGSRYQFHREQGAGTQGVWFETGGFRYLITETFPPRGESGDPEATLAVYRADAPDRPVARFTCHSPYVGGLARF